MRKYVPYVLTVVLATLGAYLAAQQGVKETATISYYNSVDACLRGNDTIRRPLNNFFSVFYIDESNEHDDPEVERAAKEARDETIDVQCVDLVEKVGPADEYLPPEER